MMSEHGADWLHSVKNEFCNQKVKNSAILCHHRSDFEYNLKKVVGTVTLDERVTYNENG